MSKVKNLVQALLAKSKVIKQLLTHAGRNFHVTQRELKHCDSCRIFYLMKLKPEKKRCYLILEYDYVT